MFRQHGLVPRLQHVTGVITAADVRGGGAGGGRSGPRPNWVQISYEYSVGEQLHSGRSKAPATLAVFADSPSAGRGLVGNLIDVYYDNTDPTVSRLSPFYDIAPFVLLLGSRPFLLVILTVIFSGWHVQASHEMDSESDLQPQIEPRRLPRRRLILSVPITLLLAVNAATCVHALSIGDRLAPAGSGIAVIAISGVFALALAVLLAVTLGARTRVESVRCGSESSSDCGQ